MLHKYCMLLCLINFEFANPFSLPFNKPKNIYKETQATELLQKKSLLLEKIRLHQNITNDDLLENDPNLSKINGKWNLIYSDAGDTMFDNDVNISQIVNISDHQISNIITYKHPKKFLKIKQIVVYFKAILNKTNTRRVNLEFQSVKILRNSRIGLHTIILPAPRFIIKLIRLVLNLNKVEDQKKELYKEIMYLDNDLLIKKSSQGKIYISQR